MLKSMILFVSQFEIGYGFLGMLIKNNFLVLINFLIYHVSKCYLVQNLLPHSKPFPKFCHDFRLLSNL